jgi:hypothetical protein
MSFISPALKGIIKLRKSVMDNFLLNPIDTQKQVFNKLISSAQFTEYGKDHNFEKINSIQDFQQQVPINDYESLKKYIEATIEGQQNILWPSEINWFAKSSGTTSDKSKFIPVSTESLKENHFKSGKDILSLYIQQFPDSKITDGKCLVIGGSHQINQMTEDSFYGDLSAVMIQNMPSTWQLLRTPELATALLSEWEEKIERIAQETIHENVTFIAGVPTWTVVLIKRIFEITGKDNLLDVWPNLELYIHGGVSFTPYRAQFQSMIRGEQMHYLETYNASEGFFAAQDNLNEEGMALFLNHGIFYEFLPIEQIGETNPSTCLLHEVELGKNYALIISTNGGLWRYNLGDTVQFTSLDPFRIKVTGRVKFFINAFGEEVIVDNADQAIAAACEKTNALVSDYTAAPIFMNADSNGAHEWLIEFEKAPTDLNLFIETLDLALQKINSDYEAKRYKNIALRMPVVHAIPQGAFHDWLKSKGKLGGQHKIPRLSNDRNWIEEMKQFMKL